MNRLAAAMWATLLLHLPAQAGTSPAKLVAPASEISFTIRQMGVPVDGRFEKFSAEIALDPLKPETGSVSFTIDAGSARFGVAETDTELRKAPWLNVAAFPQATFRSSAIKATGPGRFEVAGKLTIKGTARDVLVAVQLTQGASSTGTATGGFSFKRIDFKVGEGEWADTSLVANDVQVRFKLVLSGLQPR